MLQFVHLYFPYYPQFYINRKGPFLCFNQGPRTTLIRPRVYGFALATKGSRQNHMAISHCCQVRNQEGR